MNAGGIAYIARLLGKLFEYFNGYQLLEKFFNSKLAKIIIAIFFGMLIYILLIGLIVTVF
jgi:hypothetical protein